VNELVPVRIVAAEHALDLELYGNFGAIGWAPVIAGAVVGAVIGSMAGGRVGLGVGLLAGGGVCYAVRGELLALALSHKLLPEPEWFNGNGDPARVFRGDDGVPYSVTW
jgi:hypothetical protein